MLVTLLGMVTEVRPLQPANARLPMLVTLFPITHKVITVQFLKASSLMLVTSIVRP